MRKKLEGWKALTDEDVVWADRVGWDDVLHPDPEWDHNYDEDDFVLDVVAAELLGLSLEKADGRVELSRIEVAEGGYNVIISSLNDFNKTGFGQFLKLVKDEEIVKDLLSWAKARHNSGVEKRQKDYEKKRKEAERIRRVLGEHTS